MILLLLLMGIVWALYETAPERKILTIDPVFEELIWMLYNQFDSKARDMSFENFRTEYIQTKKIATVDNALSLARRRIL